MSGKTAQDKVKTETKTACFVIMPISTQTGYEEGHFQLVYEDILQPSIEVAGMSPYRADETKNTNLIHLDILRRVIETPIAVCDMSSKNPNVFYELGMRQAFDMPTVLVKDDVTDTPFDISGLRYVTYSKEMKHRDVISVVKELAQVIDETYQKKDDRSEINSLIRLMELANPAKLNQVELTDEVRYEKLNELHLKEIMNSIDKLNKSQAIIMDRMNSEMLYKNSNEIKHINVKDYIISSDNIRSNKDIIEEVKKRLEKRMDDE